MESGILAIETSTRRGSVALWRGGRVVSEASFYANRSHNSAVFEPLKKLLELGGDEIGMVVVGTGPGSYTGARVGIAAGQGVAMVKGIGLVGVASVCAAEVDADDYAVVGDARRGAFFWVEVKAKRMVGEVEMMLGRDALDERIAAAGLETVTFDEGLSGIGLSRPVAGRLAESAARWVPEQEATAAVEPIYLGAPFVTTAKPRGIG
ncbi:MAG: tRNA (adenosine(37)-N6)-threonylcarbamoyltransferase complex dimerization subunit type 1 TsaB [Verrucomicrobiales bacterium]|nr:tRNA (adenosine(37)-N6)-threonylcarbamoyltransferase complex dimerization subunit type 1 TsaB [Verrucomicrobiales bacterium]